jgi:hypothetical protein
MAVSNRLKKALELAGFVLGLLGMAFVISRIIRVDRILITEMLTWRTLLILTPAALIFLLGGGLLALAWWETLESQSVTMSRTHCMSLFGISQLAKYVPGTVFQYLGRHAGGTVAGIRSRPLIKSYGWELGLLLLAGAVTALLALPLTGLTATAGLPGLIFVMAAALCFGLMNFMAGRHLARALGLYLIYILLSGTSFALILALRGSWPAPVGPSILLEWIGAYAVAWVLGLVTFGAPAGLGAREAVLFALLSRSVGQSDLLGSIVLVRLANLGGDAFFFLLAVSMKAVRSRQT